MYVYTKGEAGGGGAGGGVGGMHNEMPTLPPLV